MKVTVLIDNIAHGECAGEWGLSFYIEYEGRQILLDGGATGKITENAEKCGINLAEADFAVLSHAHYDHADGLAAFLEVNRNALLYIRAGSKENCYGIDDRGERYIGIAKDFLEKYKERIAYVSGDYELFPGVFLIPHKTENLEEIGKKGGLYIKSGTELVPDGFAHEQSLVFDTEKGLVIFNSCSHGGVENIVYEVTETLPCRKVYAYLGGMHLFQTPDDEVKALAERFAKLGIERIITGHCTGEKAVSLLQDNPDLSVEQMYSGMEIIL
ncbi:MAG: MBL fold metallo-hydrolase [Eubacterium sp.]|nr:MBL fold metallo-hydrolase [Eubacterium sp.]